MTLQVAEEVLKTYKERSFLSNRKNIDVNMSAFSQDYPQCTISHNVSRKGKSYDFVFYIITEFKQFVIKQ